MVYKEMRGVKRSILHLANVIDKENVAKRSNVFDTRIEDFYKSRNSTSIDNGHGVMMGMRELLERIDTDTFWRSKDQRIIQHRIMAGVARLVYGPELRANEEVVKKYNRFESLRQEIFLTAPRRGGKTQCVAQMCAVMLLSIPNVDIAAFAPSSRAAGGDSGLMGHVKKILTSVFKWTKFEKKNEEILSIIFGDSDERKFKAYPGGATNKYVYFFFTTFLLFKGFTSK